MNRLNKTKEEREVDHEQERVDREKKESAERKAAALKQVRQSIIQHFYHHNQFSHREKKQKSLRRSTLKRRLRATIQYSM